MTFLLLLLLLLLPDKGKEMKRREKDIQHAGSWRLFEGYISIS